jgi:hypothetical protein
MCAMNSPLVRCCLLSRSGNRLIHVSLHPLAHRGILLESDGTEFLLVHVLSEVPARCVDLDLTNMRVAAVLVVGEYGHLDEVRAQCALFAALLLRGAHAGWQNGHPAARLVEFLHVYLLQVMKGAANTNRYL